MFNAIAKYRPSDEQIASNSTHCLVTLPARAVAKYCDEYVCLCVCLSGRISPEPHARSLPFFAHVAYVRGSVLVRHVYDRPHRLLSGSGFLPPLKRHYRPGKGDRIAPRGRSMLSTIALC